MADKAPRIVVFGCRHTATPVMLRAGGAEAVGLPKDSYVELPCLGSLDSLEVLRTLDWGAVGVVAVGCYRSRCKHLTGSHRAERVMAHVGNVLEEVGMGRDRIALVLGSPLEEGKIILALQEFKESLGGNTP
jgi:coenzyme F420-reducing hydrogenase delta subunit